jgi:hypothetical protein
LFTVTTRLAVLHTLSFADRNHGNRELATAISFIAPTVAAWLRTVAAAAMPDHASLVCLAREEKLQSRSKLEPAAASMPHTTGADVVHDSPLEGGRARKVVQILDGSAEDES